MEQAERLLKSLCDYVAYGPTEARELQLKSITLSHIIMLNKSCYKVMTEAHLLASINKVIQRLQTRLAAKQFVAVQEQQSPGSGSGRSLEETIKTRGGPPREDDDDGDSTQDEPVYTPTVSSGTMSPNGSPEKSTRTPSPDLC